MPEKKSVEQLMRKYERLKASVSKIDLVQAGSITERIDRRPNAKGEMREHGPYYQWTFKEKGKTRTFNLTREQARQWTKAIANQRKLEIIIEEMRSTSRQILMQTTESVPSRKRSNHEGK
jgi:hypothetical protein